MKLDDYDDRDGKKVWLTNDEVDDLLSESSDTEQSIALGLGVCCGLRAAEVVAATPADLVETSIGSMLRVWEGKGSKYREMPVPSDLSATIRAYADVRPDDVDAPPVEKSTRTVRRWVAQAGEARHWLVVPRPARSPSDLGDAARRGRGRARTGDGVGWLGDWETFREHYLGAYLLDAQQKGMEKVAWL